MNNLIRVSFIFFCGLFGLSIISCGNKAKESKQEVTMTEQGEVKNTQESLVNSASSENNTSVITSKDFCNAALEGDLDIISSGLSSGVEVNTCNESGCTALMYASFNGHVAIMKLLLSEEANINLSDKAGRTALMLASTSSEPEAVKVLLEHKAKVNLYDVKDHFTALMYAAAEGKLENAKLLIKYHADPDLLTTENHSAWFFSQNNHNKEVADYLKPLTRNLK